MPAQVATNAILAIFLAFCIYCIAEHSRRSSGGISGSPVLDASVVGCFVSALIYWLSLDAKPSKPTRVQERASHEDEVSPAFDKEPPSPRLASHWWLSCCMGFEERAKATKLAHGGSKVHSGYIHVKFSGLRLKQPRDELPDCRQFVAGPLEESVYGGWSKLNCSEREKDLCLQLLQRIKSVKGSKDPITLLRYLRARAGNVEKAAKMYIDSMQWRSSDGLADGFEGFKIDDRLHRRFDEAWKVLGLLGRDRDGDPILWERMGLADFNSYALTPAKFLRQHEVYTLVRIQQAMNELTRTEGRPYMYWTVVSDLQGIGWQHFNMSALQKYKEIVRVGQDYFPDVVKRILIIRAPRVFTLIWNIAQHFFDEGTREKIQIVSQKDTETVLTKYIDPMWIPQSLGGTCCIQSNADCKPLISVGGPTPPDLLSEIRKRFGD